MHVAPAHACTKLLREKTCTYQSEILVCSSMYCSRYVRTYLSLPGSSLSLSLCSALSSYGSVSVEKREREREIPSTGVEVGRLPYQLNFYPKEALFPLFPLFPHSTFTTNHKNTTEGKVYTRYLCSSVILKLGKSLPYPYFLITTQGSW